jgi:hypothetical protein
MVVPGDIPADIVERQLKLTQHPKAHFMNLRTMEILRAYLSTSYDRILEAASPACEHALPQTDVAYSDTKSLCFISFIFSNNTS